MAELKEKVAYLHGLSKGLSITECSPEGKLLVHIVDVLQEFATEFTHMATLQNDLEEYVETIDEDLTDLEEEVYEEEGYETNEYVEVECPDCHKEISFKAELLAEADELEVTCPFCGRTVYDTVAAWNQKEVRALPPVSERLAPAIHPAMHPGL